jgi:hypothetical protein
MGYKVNNNKGLVTVVIFTLIFGVIFAALGLFGALWHPPSEASESQSSKGSAASTTFETQIDQWSSRSSGISHYSERSARGSI